MASTEMMLRNENITVEEAQNGRRVERASKRIVVTLSIYLYLRPTRLWGLPQH
jgi:hypothetical protein